MQNLLKSKKFENKNITGFKKKRDLMLKIDKWTGKLQESDPSFIYIQPCHVYSDKVHVSGIFNSFNAVMPGYIFSVQL